MKLRVLIFLSLVLFLTTAFGQKDSTIHVKEFPGENVGAKITNATATCGTNASVPCILVIDSSLATWAPGAMPTLCPHCYLVDHRMGGESGFPRVTPDGANGIKVVDNVAATTSVTSNGSQVNILAYGAVSDRTHTISSSAAIQMALDAIGDNSTVLIPPGIFNVTSTLRITHSNEIVRSEGGILHCMTISAACVQNGDNVPRELYMNNVLQNIRMEPGVQSAGPAILNNDYGLQISNPVFIINHPNYFHNLIEVKGDEQFHLDGANNVAGVIQCDSTWCGNVVYGDNASVGWISNSSLSTVCTGNDIDWPSGNDLHLSSVIMQSFNQYGLRYLAGADGHVLASKTHVESGGCPNPTLSNIRSNAGYIMNGGTLQSDQGELGGMYPNFLAWGNTGGRTWWYWVIIHSANGGSDTAPMPIGYTNNAPTTWTIGTTVTPIWPSIAPVGGDTITCTLLRTTGVSPSPYYGDGLADQVAAAIPCGRGTYTSYADSVAQSSLTVHTFALPFSSFLPYLSNWPGSVVLGARETNNIYTQATFSGTCPSAFNFVTESQPTPYTIPQVECVGPTHIYQSLPYSPAAFSQSSAYIANYGSAAFMLRNQFPFGSTPGNIKGVLNLGSSGDADVIQLSDSNVYKTQATSGNRPVADLADSALGMDVGLAERSGTSISQYINHLFDNSAWLERLTSTRKTFKVPVQMTTLGTAGIVTNDASGNIGTETNVTAAQLPVATTLALGGVKCDGTSITCAGNGTISATSSTLPSNVPQLKTASILFIASGVMTCANLNGCIQITRTDGTVAVANTAAAATQDLQITPKSENPNLILTYARIKSTAACTGSRGLTVQYIGDCVAPNSIASPAFSLTAAVGDSNLYQANLVGLKSAIGSCHITTRLQVTSGTVDQTAAGCAFKIWLMLAAGP